MQEIPRCFLCAQPVEHDPIYEAPCGHDDHGSAIFHPLCLMDWRERREGAVVALNRYMTDLQEQARRFAEERESE